MKRGVGVIVAVLAAVTPALAQAPGLTLSADNQTRGRIGLALTGPAGAALSITETTRDAARPRGTVPLDAAGRGALPKAATWRCEPRRRTFRAAGTAPDGTPLAATARTRTPGCKHRYRVRVRPRRPRAGDDVRVKVRDRFRLDNTTARICVGKRCVRARTGRTRKLTVARAGRIRATATIGERRARSRPIRVRRRPPLTLLAAGDSMMQIVDGFLKERLAARRVTVRSDARPSTGLSKPFFFDWPRHARRQAARSTAADITVMFIGANDGFPLDDARCCGAAWARAYAKRVSRMMRSYARAGAARVYWCLLPAPKDPAFRRVFAGVNAGIRRAARRHPKTATVVDLPRTFTPGFAYRPRISGTTVRQPDGIHLNVAGASIAANRIIRAIRRDGVV